MLPTALMHVPWSVTVLPLMAEATEAWFAHLTTLRASPSRGLGVAHVHALWQGFANLTALRDAGLIDAAALHRSCAELPPDAPLPPADVVDRWLVAPVLLGLGRFPRQASTLPAPCLELVAVLLAVDAWRPLVQPDDVPERLARGPGCHLDPWVARRLPAGRWLAAQLGYDRLVQAAAGSAERPVVCSSSQLALALRLTSEEATPAELLDPSAGFDAEQAAWLEDVVDLACVGRRRDKGLPRGHVVRPAGGGLRFDLGRGRLAPLAPTSLGQATSAGWMEPPWTGLPLPPGLCAVLQRAGWRGLELHLREVDAVADALDLLFDLCEEPIAPQRIEGEDFELRPT